MKYINVSYGFSKKIGYAANDLYKLIVYLLWSNVGLKEDIEFYQLPFTPAVVVFVLANNVALFELTLEL